MIRGNEERQFLVTLPSNACDDRYPNNRPGNYKTHLPVPVELNDDWEVALVDVQYPQTWSNFMHTTRVVLDVSLGKDAGIIRTADNSKPYKLPTRKPKTPTRDQVFQEKLNEHTTSSGTSVTFATVVKPGHFDTVKQFGESLAHQFNTAFDTMYPNRKHKLAVKYIMDPTNTYSDFTYENIIKTYMWCDNEYVMKVLGYEAAARLGDGTDADPFIYLYKLFGVPPTEDPSERRPCSLSRAFSIYVYSDIIKSQIVGDVRAPLLGVVPVAHHPVAAGTRTVDKIQYWCFNPTYYMPLRLSRFDTVDILLATDEGLEVAFGNSTDKVVCRLHFQRRATSSTI